MDSSHTGEKWELSDTEHQQFIEFKKGYVSVRKEVLCNVLCNILTEMEYS
jgi:hypothetical protein